MAWGPLVCISDSPLAPYHRACLGSVLGPCRRTVPSPPPLEVPSSRSRANYPDHPRSSDRDPLAELVRVHKLCLLRAADKGLDPDQPRSLARSIILDS